MRVPSSRKPVELGLAPRTIGNGSSDTTDATPGSVWITRNGSPNVPGIFWISSPAQRDARDLVAALLGDHDGLVEVVAFALDEVGDRQLLPGRERLLLHEGVVLRREDRHARGAGRQRQAKVPAGVGLGPVVLVAAPTGGDGRGRERAARAELDEAPAQHGRERGACRRPGAPRRARAPADARGAGTSA